MNAHRRYAGAATVCLSTLTVVHLYLFAQLRLDQAQYQDAPSCLYITKSFPIQNDLQELTLGPQAGDLLLKINGYSIGTVEEAQLFLSKASLLGTLNVEVFRPAERRTVKFDLPVTSRKMDLRQLPPSIYVSHVEKWGPSDQAGIQEGDLIFRVDGKILHKVMDKDPLHLLLQSISGKINALSLDANIRILHKVPAGPIRFEGLRNGRSIDIEVIPVSSLRSWSYGPLFLIILLLILFLTCRSLMESPPTCYHLRILAVSFALCVIFIRFNPWYGILDVARDFVAVFALLLAVNNPHREHFLQSSILATAAVAILLYVNEQDIFAAVFNLSAIAELRTMIFRRGPISLAIVWTFIFSLDYLRQIWLKRFQPSSPRERTNEALSKLLRLRELKLFAATLSDQVNAGQAGFYGRKLFNFLERVSADPQISIALSTRDEILSGEEDDFVSSLAVIRWGEAALPILGFLGTVVGMGNALSETAESVRVLLNNAGDIQAQENIKDAFDGIGVAFDTTFLGLACLLLLSVAHVTIRKMLVINLSTFRMFLNGVMDIWSADSSIHRQREHLQFLHVVRALTGHVIRETDAEIFHKIKKALFAPWIEFEQFGSLARGELRDAVSSILSDEEWHYAGIWAPFTSSSGHALLKVGCAKGRYILRAPLVLGSSPEIYEVSNDYHWICPAGDARHFLGIAGLKFLHGFIPPGGTRQAEGKRKSNKHSRITEATEGLISVRENSQIVHLSSFEVGRAQVGVFVCKSGSVHEVWTVPIGRDEPPKLLVMLEQVYDWKLYATNSASATVFAVGQHREDESWCLSSRLFGERDIQKVHLKEVRNPTQMHSVSSSEILLLDESGSLFYVDIKNDFQKKMNHLEWEPVKHRNCLIRLGKKGWMAVVARGRLRMWKVVDRELLPYEGRDFEIGNLRSIARGMSSRGDDILIAAGGRDIATWHYPRSFIDRLE